MEIKINPKYEKCLPRGPNVTTILDNINITDYYKPNIIWNQEEKGLIYTIPKIVPQTYFALLDIDWTITYAQKKMFNWDTDDIHIIPGRLEKITQLFKIGYTIVFVTNQLASTPKNRQHKMDRIGNFLRKLGIPSYAFISTDKDKYRKPGIGIWQKLKTLVPHIDYAFFVGDALGRPQDFSDSDKEFALAVGIPYYSPEEFFPPTPPITLPKGKSMVILVGMPGSGKSIYATTNLVPKGYEHISRDNLGGNKDKFIKAIKKAVKDGVHNIVADSTNPALKDREILYKIAQDNGYSITVLYFIMTGTGWNNIREKGKGKVPSVVYHVFFKNLEPPTESNTPGQLYLMYR